MMMLADQQAEVHLNAPTRKKCKATIKSNIQKRQGLKEWNIDGIVVTALNKKNAVRKANNIRSQK